MKIDCNSYHLAFLLFILQAGFDVQEKVFGLIKVKLDSLDATFVSHFPTFDVLYFMFYGLSNLFFWRMPWTFGFRKVAIVSLTLRSLLYFCCMMAPAESPMTYSGVLWALQGLLQGFIQAPLTGLILQQFRQTDDTSGRFNELRWVVFTFFVGIVSSAMAFVSAPNVADETLCSTLITVGLLVVNILNYVVCFFPYEQVELGMSTLRNEKEAPMSGTAINRFLRGFGDRLREIKQFFLDRQIMSICIGLTLVQCVRYYIFLRLPLELYYRVLFPAPPFQLMFLGGASLFEVIGLLGCIVMLIVRSRAPFVRDIESPFAMAFLALLFGCPFFTPGIKDVDQIEDSYYNMTYLSLYVFGFAFTYYARIVLMGPALLRLAESRGNIPAVLAFVHGLVSFAFAWSIFFAELTDIGGLVERVIPFTVIGGLSSLLFFFVELCSKRQTVSSLGGSSYRPLLADHNVEAANL